MNAGKGKKMYSRMQNTQTEAIQLRHAFDRTTQQ